MFNAIKIRIIRWLLRKYLNKKTLIKWGLAVLNKIENLSDKSEIDNEVAAHLRKELDIKPTLHII